MRHLLILEDDESLKRSLAREFSERGYQVTQKKSFSEITEFNFDFALVDLRLGPDNGLKAVEGILRIKPGCKVVVLTGYASVATAVEAIKLGATNYLTKPVGIDLIEKAFSGESQTPDLPQEMLPLSKHEHEYIEFVVSQNDGNISRSAKILGLHRSSLQRKLKKLP